MTIHRDAARIRAIFPSRSLSYYCVVCVVRYHSHWPTFYNRYKKQLSCRKEAARCFMSLNMCLSCTVTDIFGIEYCRDLEIWVRGCSMSLKMVALESLGPAFAFHSNCGCMFSRFDRIHERNRHLI